MKVNKKKGFVRSLVFSGVCLALCLLLPFLTGQIPQVGKALAPMHIPVLLCGFVCGPWWALAVGAVAPLLRHALVGMPVIYPTAIAMCFELAAYGAVSGLLYRALPKKTVNIYVSLVAAMLAGRVVWGVLRVILMGLGNSSFGWAVFVAEGFVNALPGIVVHIAIIPVLVLALKKAGYIEE